MLAMLLLFPATSLVNASGPLTRFVIPSLK
jgi:hypothetical protein